MPGAAVDSNPRDCMKTLRISFLGNFDQAWSTERYAADALECVGHAVNRIHEYGVRTRLGRDRADQSISIADCLVFFKGRIGVDPRDANAVLSPNPTRLLELIRRSPVPAYLWYYDRVHELRRRALASGMDAAGCSVVHDRFRHRWRALTSTDWANWHVLRQGISRPTVTNISSAGARSG